MSRLRYSLNYRRASRYDLGNHSVGTKKHEDAAKRQYIAFCLARGRLFFPPDAQSICEFLRERSLRCTNGAVRGSRNALRAYFLRMQADDAIQDIILHFGRESDTLWLAVKQPLSLTALRSFLSPLREAEPLDFRDRALLGPLVTGLASQESLRALRSRDAVFTQDGLLLFTSHPLPRVIHLRAVSGPVCLVRALRSWLAIRSPRPDDYVFVGRGPRGDLKSSPIGPAHIDCLLRKLVLRSGYDPRRYGTGRLRAYFTLDVLSR